MCADQIINEQIRLENSLKAAIAKREENKTQSCLQLMHMMQQLIEKPRNGDFFLNRSFFGNIHSYYTYCPELMNFVDRHNSTNSPIKLKIEYPSYYGPYRLKYVDRVHTHVDTKDKTITYYFEDEKTHEKYN